MINFLQETMEAIKATGLKEENIIFIGTDDEN